MKNKYFGDIGDFGKYALLRYIQERSPKLKLGINWYLNEIESKNNDGKFMDYLHNQNFKFKSIDETLYKKLKKILVSKENRIIKKNRNIKQVRKAGILKPFIEFDEPIPLGKEERKEWFAKSLETFRPNNCRLIFLDPDNQIEIKSKPWSNKHVRKSEISDYWERGFSLLIYNHRDRSDKQEYLQKLRKLPSELKLKGPSSIQILEYSHGTQRHYVFLIQKRDQAELRFLFEEKNKLLKKENKKHFFKLLKN